MHPGGKADGYRMCAGAFHEGAKHDGPFVRLQLEAALLFQAFRQAGLLQLIEIHPQAVNLAFGIAAQDGADGFAFGPERRHARTGTKGSGVDQIIAKPFRPQSLGRTGQIERLDAKRFMAGKLMAGNAIEPFNAHQIAAVFVAAHFVFAAVPRCGFHIGAGIGRGE